MNANFDKKAFDVNFDNAIDTLTKSEKITKDTLRELSRSVLEVHFFTEDISYINRTLNALSPVNKRAATEYFKAFAGFQFSLEAQVFTKKDKKQFEQKKEETAEFLADVHNNIWTWADRNLQIEAKPFDINAVSKYFASAIKKAEKAGYSDVDVLAQVFASGIDISAITQAMQKLVPVESQVMVLDSIVEVSPEDEESRY